MHDNASNTTTSRKLEAVLKTLERTLERLREDLKARTHVVYLPPPGLKALRTTSDLFRLTEAKEYVGLAPNTVRAMITKGLHVYTFGKIPWVSISDLDSFLKRHPKEDLDKLPSNPEPRKGKSKVKAPQEATAPEATATEDRLPKAA